MWELHPPGRTCPILPVLGMTFRPALNITTWSTTYLLLLSIHTHTLEGGTGLQQEQNSLCFGGLTLHVSASSTEGCTLPNRCHAAMAHTPPSGWSAPSPLPRVLLAALAASEHAGARCWRYPCQWRLQAPEKHLPLPSTSQCRLYRPAMPVATRQATLPLGPHTLWLI